MRGRRFGPVCFAAALVSALVVQAGDPAGAVVDSCGMTEFPAKLISYSGLKVACTSTTSGSGALTVHDFSNAAWHLGAARTVTAATTNASATITSATGFLSAVAGAAGDVHRAVKGPGIPNDTFIKSVVGSTAVLSASATATAAAASLTIENSQSRTLKDAHVGPAGTTLTSATAGFNASDLNQLIGGTGVKPGTKILAVVNATTVTLSQGGTLPIVAATVRQVSIGDSAVSTARMIADGATTAASPIVTSLTAKFLADDTGIGITGPGIPVGTYIKTVTNATTIVMTKNATATAAAVKLAIGQPTKSAPANGDHVSQLAGELNLNPLFVPGVDACAENTPEGFMIAGAWYNPGSFLAVGTAPARSIAQIVYATSVVSFAAFVVVNTTDAANLAAHYDIVYGGLPVGVAGCPGSPSATTFTFNAITTTQGASSSGTPFVRANPDVLGAGPISATGKVTSGASTYATTCSIGRQVSNPGFVCGNATVGLAG